MKTLNKTVFLAVVLFFCCAAFAVQTQAQCVSCAPAGTGFVCVPTGNGGSGCVTDGTACTMIGACTQGGGGVDQPEGRSGSSEPCKLNILKNPQVSIDDSMIRQVGAVDPRLAIALLSLSKIRVEFTVAKISFSSMDYTFEDVENHLTQTSGSAYYKEMRKRSGEILAKNGIVITYDVSINASRGTNSFTLNISPSGGTGTSIELDLQQAAFGTGKTQSEGFKATSFQFK